jgi:hypothetical protein
MQMSIYCIQVNADIVFYMYAICGQMNADIVFYMYAVEYKVLKHGQ